MITFCFCHNGPPFLEVADATFSSAVTVTLFMISMAATRAPGIARSLLIAIERKVNKDSVL